MDERLNILLRQRSVRCELRKQPQALTLWWRLGFDYYSKLWVRSDSTTHPVKGILNELFTLLKFIALPNNRGKKMKLLEAKWPTLQEKITPYL